MFGFGNSCERIRRLLSDRIDEPLSARQEATVQRHLAGCEACRHEAEFYAEIRQSAAELDAVTPPDYLWERISLSIDEHPWGDEDAQSRRQRGRITGLLSGSINYAGAALTFGLIALLCLVPNGSSTNRASDQDTSIRAEEVGSDIAYISLYMMSHHDRFPYEVQDYYLNQLSNLDQQIKMIKSALDRFPNNRQVKEQLARAYSQKLKLYRQLGISSPTDHFDGPGASAGDEYHFRRGGRYD